MKRTTDYTDKHRLQFDEDNLNRQCAIRRHQTLVKKEYPELLAARGAAVQGYGRGCAALTEADFLLRNSTQRKKR